MLSSTLSFLKDNQAILTWIGSGLVVAVSGLWAVVRFFAKRSSHEQSKSSINADRGSIAAGRDITIKTRVHSDHSRS